MTELHEARKQYIKDVLANPDIHIHIGLDLFRECVSNKDMQMSNDLGGWHEFRELMIDMKNNGETVLM